MFTIYSPKSIISYWKRHFFVFLATGDLLYFRDDSLNELQGRVDVRHAPTVRVTGERIIEEKKKESLFKFASKLSALERQACLVWIATPPSKMFVIKLQDEHEGAVVATGGGGKRQELTPAAKFVLVAIDPRYIYGNCGLMLTSSCCFLYCAIENGSRCC